MNQTQQPQVTHKMILKHDPKTFTHTSNRKGKVTDTNNNNSEQKLLSNRTLLVVVPTMNPRIGQRIVPIVAAPQTLLTSKTEEVVTNVACGGAWVNRTLH